MRKIKIKKTQIKCDYLHRGFGKTVEPNYVLNY